MTRPAPSARRVWWSRTESRTSGWTVTEETASDDDAEEDGSSRRAGEEPYVAGEALSVPIWCVLFFVRCGGRSGKQAGKSNNECHGGAHGNEIYRVMGPHFDPGYKGFPPIFSQPQKKSKPFGQN